MLAAAGALDQIGRVYGRAWGDIADPRSAPGSRRTSAPAPPSTRLRGSTFGRIGGRPMGMYTAVSNADQWLRAVRRRRRGDRPVGARAPQPTRSTAARVVAARAMARAHAAGVHYDGERLTPELLERQIRSYYAMRELIDEWNLDFCGIKAQPELTDNFATMDVDRGVPQRPVRLGRPEGADRLRDRGRHGRGADDADPEALSATAGAVRRRAPLPRAISTSGTSATRASTRPGSRPAATIRPRTCATSTSTRRSSTSRPAAPRSTTSPRPGEFTFARLTRLDGRYRMQVLRGAARAVRRPRRTSG